MRVIDPPEREASKDLPGKNQLLGTRMVASETLASGRCMLVTFCLCVWKSCEKGPRCDTEQIKLAVSFEAARDPFGLIRNTLTFGSARPQLRQSTSHICPTRPWEADQPSEPTSADMYPPPPQRHTSAALYGTRCTCCLFGLISLFYD